MVLCKLLIYFYCIYAMKNVHKLRNMVAVIIIIVGRNFLSCSSNAEIMDAVYITQT